MEVKYYIITFVDGNKAYIRIYCHLWEILKNHYDNDKIACIQRVMEREFYNEIHN